MKGIEREEDKMKKNIKFEGELKENFEKRRRLK